VELSADQDAALTAILNWFIEAPSPEFCTKKECCPRDHSHNLTCAQPHTHGRARDFEPFALGGLAGSGKTTMVRQVEWALDVKAAFGTPTNKAAAVLRGKLHDDQKERVRTYHSLLYKPFSRFWCGQTGRDVVPVENEDASEDDLHEFVPCWQGTHLPRHDCSIQEELKFTRREHLEGHRHLLVLDEASMVGQERVEEIRQFGIPLLLVGDHGQLPPVKAVGGANRWMRKPDVVLTQNHRQGEASGIVTAALSVRERGVLDHGRYGDGSTVCASARRHPEILAVMDPERFAPGPERVIICHTNAVRAQVNKQFHAFLTDQPGPVAGDRVVSLANVEGVVVDRVNEKWVPRRGAPKEGDAAPLIAIENVYNGCTGTVREVLGSSRHTVRLVVELDADSQGRPGTHVSVAALSAQFGRETQVPYNERPHGAHQLWDFAYALTAHKAQGSEFDDVIVLDTHPPEYRAWLYTAMTRAKKRLLVIDWRS